MFYILAAGYRESNKRNPAGPSFPLRQPGFFVVVVFVDKEHKIQHGHCLISVVTIWISPIHLNIYISFVTLQSKAWFALLA